MNQHVKRAAWIALAVAALAADSMISVRLAAKPTALVAAATVPEQADPLGQFRLEREQLRAREEAQLNQLIYSGGAEGESAQARRRLMELMDQAQAENTLEGVLMARGFEDAVVTVSGRSANVLLRRETPLTQQESAVVLELVMRETGLAGGSVKIIPVK